MPDGTWCSWILCCNSWLFHRILCMSHWHLKAPLHWIGIRYKVYTIIYCIYMYIPHFQIDLIAYWAQVFCFCFCKWIEEGRCEWLQVIWNCSESPSTGRSIRLVGDSCDMLWLGSACSSWDLQSVTDVGVPWSRSRPNHELISKQFRLRLDFPTSRIYIYFRLLPFKSSHGVVWGIVKW